MIIIIAISFLQYTQTQVAIIAKNGCVSFFAIFAPALWYESWKVSDIVVVHRIGWSWRYRGFYVDTLN